VRSNSKLIRAAVAAMLFAALAGGATRPRYGGTLRVQIRETADAADAAPIANKLSALTPSFKLETWEPGKRAVYRADDAAPGGRPFLDAIEIEMGRPLREQAIDLRLGKVDVIQLGPDELRRQSEGRQIWTSSPVRVIALVFSPKADDARLREVLALAVDRGAIHNVLLQRSGEISAALLPQWLSGYAFLFPTAPDAAKARSLAGSIPPASRRITIAADDPSLQPIADRIALNARDAGIAIAPAPRGSEATVRLTEARIESDDPAKALAAIAAAFGLPAPPRADSTEALYAAEHGLLEDFRVIPLFHLPETYGAASRVAGGPGITPAGDWDFDGLWLEDARP
jgi:ABC-type transport system substrate-binding protein